MLDLCTASAKISPVEKIIGSDNNGITITIVTVTTTGDYVVKYSVTGISYTPHAT